MFLSPSYRENIRKAASIWVHQSRKTIKAPTTMNLWPYGELLPLVHSAKRREWVLFRAQDILQDSTMQIQVFIKIFIFIYIHLTSLPLSTDKSAKHTMEVSISLNILASHFRVWRTYSRQWRLQSTVVNSMNFYSAKTIEEYSKALYINLTIP